MTGPADGSPGERFDLVIFDCDGVLVDTERVANRLLTDALAALGLELTFEQTVDVFKGRSGKDCRAIVEERLGAPPPADLFERCRQRIIEQFEAEPRSIPGIHHALGAIEAPTCVASSGEHDKMRRTLGAVGLFERFEGRIYSASEVARGKPEPDLFLHAAARMGFASARCVVVEDSVPGVQAAVAAGMRVLGYVDLTPAPALQAAGAVCFDDMHDLPGLLR